MSQLFESHNIKTELLDFDESAGAAVGARISPYQNNQHHHQDDDFESQELYNSALIEDLTPNDKLKEDMDRFFASRREKNNKRNLINYCGVLDSTSETDGCARANSIYVAKFGNSHIKKTKIVNPYGALSQMYHKEMIRIQKQKLLDFTSSYIKPLNVSELKKQDQNQ